MLQQYGGGLWAGAETEAWDRAAPPGPAGGLGASVRALAEETQARTRPAGVQPSLGVGGSPKWSAASGTCGVQVGSICNCVCRPDPEGFPPAAQLPAFS